MRKYPSTAASFALLLVWFLWVLLLSFVAHKLRRPDVEITIGAITPAVQPTVRQEVDEAVATMAMVSGLNPDLIYGIIAVENPWLKPDTVNSYGAVGIMQVVGWLHLGDFPECGDDLTNVFTNVCYGVSILERKIVAAGGDMRRALLYYNGCWGATYTPGCENYPDRVLED